MCRSQVEKRGRRPLFFAREKREVPGTNLFSPVAAIILFAAGTAAQTIDRSDLELCAGLETAELKLACFEALTAISREKERAAGPE